MRRDLILLALILAAALGLRVVPAWSAVFTLGGVNFLETDSWYHVRLIENQVRNFPWRVTLDPYAAAGGQFVPIAPFYDTLTAAATVLVHGRDATTREVERVAAAIPPLLGVLAVLAVYPLNRRLFDRRAGLVAAALLAVLPGHFLDRTTLGFVDHHALEALLAVVTLLVLVRALDAPGRWSALWPGCALGLYLLAWGSGAFLVAVVGAWALAAVIVAADAGALRRVGEVAMTSALVALAFVLVFQDPRMHRYGSQVFSLVALGGAAGAALLMARRDLTTPRRQRALLIAAAAAVASAGILWLLSPAFATALWTDLLRLAPSRTRMNVLEARPLFLYSGAWRWDQPWLFFRTGFVIVVIGLPLLAAHVWRQRHMAPLLLVVFAVAALAATIGQNRFGYYLVPASALIGGWLAMRLFDWGGVPHAHNRLPARASVPLARELAIVAVAGGMFGPNLSPQLIRAHAGNLPDYWGDTFEWLQLRTPDPFAALAAGGDYYYARYPRDGSPRPAYTIMSWWDQGYWIIQRGHRVPVSNPTQERAPNAARFYTETDMTRALALLDEENARYVLADWELPFRRVADGTIMGRFQSIADWADAIHARYYEIVYRRAGEGWTPVWIFHEPYYRSMAFRLAALGGRPVTPVNAATVVTTIERTDESGRRFREVLREQTYFSYEGAVAAAAMPPGIGETAIVGLDPWQSAFPIDAVDGLVERYAARTASQAPGEAPWVRIYERRR